MTFCMMTVKKVPLVRNYKQVTRSGGGGYGERWGRILMSSKIIQLYNLTFFKRKSESLVEY